MLIRLMKYIKGYVRIRVSGYSPERFMNLCCNHNILLWDIENHCDYYIMCISIPGFFSLKPILRKTKTKVVVLERYGLPFFMPKLIRRRIFLLGLLGCIFSMIILSNYIWAIDFTGNYSITDDVMRDYLKEQNITYGSRKKQIDIEKLEEKIREDFKVITWTSAKVDGTRLTIMVKENENLHVDKQLQEKTNTSICSDLIATKDGVVVNIITRNGVPQVAKGSEVKKGDTLIKGQIPILGDDLAVKKYQYCNSDADIYIECNYNYNKKLNMVYQKKVYTNRENKVRFIEFGDNMFALPFKNKFLKYDQITDKKQVKILDNFYLPIYYGNTRWKEYQNVEGIYQEEEAQKILNDELDKFIESLEEKGVQIIENNVKIELHKNNMVAQGTIRVIEQTGQTVVIDTDEFDNSLTEKTTEPIGE